MEGEERPSKPSLLRRTGGLIRSSAKVYSTEIPKVPVDEINETTMARTIYHYLGNTVQERISGDRYANGFSPAIVLKNCGYVAKQADADYKEEFPVPYVRARGALHGLVNRGVLKSELRDELDPHNERIYYYVVDEVTLKAIAEGKTS